MPSCPCARADERTLISVAIAARRHHRRLCRRANRGSWIVGAENRPKILPGARAADGAPLAHPDAMSVACPRQREFRDRAVRSADGSDGKIGTVEDLATGRTHDVANVIAAQ